MGLKTHSNGQPRATNGAWSFATRNVPKKDRVRAWQSAMAKLCLPIAEIPEESDFDGSISCLISPLGIRFAVVEADAQSVAGKYQKQDGAIWLGTLLDGKARLVHQSKSIDLNIGDMIYGVTGGAQASLALDSRFRIIFVNVPGVAFNKRFIAPLSQRLGYLPAHGGIRQVFSGILESLAANIDQMDSQQLLPFDHSVMEFVIACAVGEESVSIIPNAESARADNLHRICQAIEMLLADPDLALSRVADELGVSSHYVQRCFSQVDLTFADYVRRRRLERCRDDLTSPLFAQRSVAEICYRWGFKAPTHFSRVFRAAYGVPPSECRRSDQEFEISQQKVGT